MMQENLPTGTVTFLFTDIEGSTRLWEAHPRAMEAAVRRHDTLLRETFESYQGYVFKTVGDAFYGAFPTVDLAIGAALRAQTLLATEPWPAETGALRVRMALHTGSADERDGDYFGPTLNRVARVLSTGHGGQILLTAVVAEMARDSLPEATSLEKLGSFRLKDLAQPEAIYQLSADGLPKSFPPLRTPDVGRQQLPAQVTSLIGRRVQVDEVKSLLRRQANRLITLTGVGGTGKTRLGLQVAAEVAEDYEHGVHFVDLSPVTDPNRVTLTIINSMTISSGTSEEPGIVLANYLAGRHLLLVLDNFEQVVDAANEIAGLLVSAPRLQILVTSRELLRVSGEREYQVPPLTLPETSQAASPDALQDFEAIALFVERAQSVNRDFQLTAENAAAVVAICMRLDGLPLAIELAAVRIRLFTPQALLARLDERLNTLGSGMRDLPQRQQTLRGAIDWSYDLLDENEQRLFRRLSVFRDSFDFVAAEAICGPGLALDVIDGLEMLLNKSLLRRAASGDDGPRFRMLETIGEYAREQLAASDEKEALLARHGAYFFELSQALGDRLRTHDQLVWFRRLDPERNNFRGAIDYYLSGSDVVPGIQMVAALTEYWLYSYQYNDANEWLDRAIALRNAAPIPVQVDVLSASGLMASYSNRLEEGTYRLDLALRLLEELDDPKRKAWAQTWWAACAVESRSAEAGISVQQAIGTFKALGYGPGISQSLNVYGENLRYTGNFDEAEKYYLQLIPIAQEIGDFRRLTMQYANLGMVAYERSDAAEMLRYARLGFPISLDYHVGETTVTFLLLVAKVAGEHGDIQLAATLLGAAIAWYDDTSVTPQPTDVSVERRLVAEIRELVGPEALELGRREGASMGMRAAVALAEQEITRLENLRT